MGAGKKTSLTGSGEDFVIREEHTSPTDANLSDCEEHMAQREELKDLNQGLMEMNLDQ